jgi:hypothetical protein
MEANVVTAKLAGLGDPPASLVDAVAVDAAEAVLQNVAPQHLQLGGLLPRSRAPGDRLAVRRLALRRVKVADEDAVQAGRTGKPFGEAVRD